MLDSLPRNAIPVESNSLAVNLKSLVISDAPNLEEDPQQSYLQALQREMPLTIRVMDQLERRIHELLDAGHNFLYNDAADHPSHIIRRSCSNNYFIKTKKYQHFVK